MTRFCNCSRRVEYKLGLNQKGGQIAEESCKTCGGKLIVGGIEPVSAEMLSSVGLEVMNSINPQLNWKTVTKGRRSRKPIARSKFGEAVLGQPTSGKTEHVPIKKRRHLLRSPSPQPRTPSLCRQDSSSPQPHSSSPLSEDHDQLPCPSPSSVQRSLSSFSNWQLRGIDGSATVKFGEGFDYEVLSQQTEGEHNCAGDFSGIELLAAAASMDDDAENARKEDLAMEDSSMPKSSDAFSLATQSKIGSEWKKSLSNVTGHEDDTDCSLVLNNFAAASQSLCGSAEDGTTPGSDSLKVDRRHWDLNTVMDAWDEPFDDSIAGNTSKDVANDDMHVEERQEGSEDHVLSNPVGTGVESSNLKIEEENKVKAVSPHGICIELPSLEESLQKPTNNYYSSVTTGASDQATEKDVDYPITSVEKSELPTTIVEKIESPTASVEKIESPTTIVEKIESPTASVEKIESPTASVEKLDSTIDVPHDSDICQDNHGHMVDRVDLTGFQEGYDSPYEDGELRGPFLYSCEENELENERVDYESDGRNGDGSDAADLPGSEIVDGGSEGSNGSERKSLLTKRFPEGNGSNSRSVEHPLRRHFMKDDSKNNEIGGKNELNAGLDTRENHDGMKRRLSDQRDAVDGKVAHMDEYVLRTSQGKLQSCTGRSSLDATDGKDIFFMQQYRSRLGGSDSRPERDIGPDKYLGRYRPAAHVSERGGVDQWTYWGSRSRYTSSYQGPEGRSQTRPRSISGDSVDKFGRLDFQDKRQTANYLSKGLHRPLVRRSPVDRDDCFGVRRRMPLTRGISSYRRGNYSHSAGREFGENFEPLPDDAATSVRLSPYISRRERSFSPSSGRGVHMPLTRRRSRSRSRTRSPMAWHSHRERNLGTRRHIRSPDFRSEARMDRIRVPFSKSTFASDYGEGYMSPPRGRFSPQRNSRWVDDRNFADNHLRRRRSPVRVLRRTERFDAVGSSGRLKSDEYFRPMIHPGRFSFMASDDRECKFETNYEDRRRDDRGEVVHRGRHIDDGGNLRRFRHTAGDEFETSNSNNGDDIRGTDPRDVPQR